MLWLCYTRRYSEGDRLLELRGLRPHGDRVSVSFACVEWAFQLFRALSRPALTALAVAFAAIVSGILTYLNISGFAPYDPTPSTHGRALRGRLYAGACAWRAHRLAAHPAVDRTQDAARRARACMCGWSAMFSAIAVIPAILVAIFAGGLAQSRCRGVVLGARANGAHQFGPRRRCVCRRAQAGHPAATSAQWRSTSTAPGPLLQTDQKRIVDILETEAQIRALAGRLCDRFHRTDDCERQACDDARPRPGDAGTDRRGAERHSGRVQSRGAG